MVHGGPSLRVVAPRTRMDNRIVARSRLAGGRGTFPRIPASPDVAIATAKHHCPGMMCALQSHFRSVLPSADGRR
jgi:hypothetical protein